jgi:Icc protein
MERAKTFIDYILFKAKLQRGHMLKVMQISDCHLAADSGFKKHGINTEQALQKVLDSIYQAKPDLLIASGDIADVPSEKAYQKFFEKLKKLNCPILSIAGNHDNKELLAAQVESIEPYIDLGSWQFIGLNSNGPATQLYGGSLGQKELDFLEEKLKQSDKPTVIVLHHPPVVPEHNWLEEARLENADEFIKRIGRHPQIKAILSGHVHYAYEIERSGIAYLSCPSTYRQFKGNSQEFAIDRSMKYGYRKLELDDAGTVFFTTEFLREVL